MSSMRFLADIHELRRGAGAVIGHGDVRHFAAATHPRRLGITPRQQAAGIPHPKTAMQLTLRDIRKTYPNGVQALDNVSLAIPVGMYGLLGPNGAGKSTLMRILATLQEADGGSAMLGGLDVLRDKDAVRRTLGYLPQEFGVYPHASADALLDYFAVLKGIAGHGARRDVVESLLRKVNLWDVRHQKLGGFSGGMRQRFGVAVA